MNQQTLSAFIWSVADLLRGDYRQSDYGKGKQKGKPQPDSQLRDTENVPLRESVADYFAREVLPHAPDAWIDPEKTKVGYEIPFNRHFYVFTPPRPLAEIDAELKQTTDRILEMIKRLSACAAFPGLPLKLHHRSS